MMQSLWPWIAAGVMRLAMCALVWLILVEGSVYNWGFGLVVCVAASGLSLLLLPPLGRVLRFSAFPGFAVFFLTEAFFGGLDVGRRAVRRPLDLQPTFIEHRLKLGSAGARLAFVCLVSLLPGTVACRLGADSLRVHLLDHRMGSEPILAALEGRLGRLFREDGWGK